MIILVIALALLTTILVGGVLGAWLTLRWVQVLQPGRRVNCCRSSLRHFGQAQDSTVRP